MKKYTFGRRELTPVDFDRQLEVLIFAFGREEVIDALLQGAQGTDILRIQLICQAVGMTEVGR